MTTQLIPFTFESQNITVHIDESGAPWWEAQDVCAVLGISDTSKAVSRLKLGEKKTSESRNVLILNEKGLYRLIMRSNKPEAERFQDWVFGEVLPQIRKTGQYQMPQAMPQAPQPALTSPQEQLQLVRDAAEFIEEMGGLTERDKLMFQDVARNLIFNDQKLLTTSTQTYGFSVAERVAFLGYRLSRAEQATYYPVLGKRLAAEYRSRHGAEPGKEIRYVDGANRPVAWYPQDCVSWMDPMIQGYMATLDIFVR